MRFFTLRLGQFALGALLLTALFRYILSLSIEAGGFYGPILCGTVYFAIMFLLGWHFGKKDWLENEIYDIGFRHHLVTYLLCNSSAFISCYIGLNTSGIRAMVYGAISWGTGLLIHYMFFLRARKNTIKGYEKSELFS